VSAGRLVITMAVGRRASTVAAGRLGRTMAASRRTSTVAAASVPVLRQQPTPRQRKNTSKESERKQKMQCTSLSFKRIK
jgi:hypothetical protein